MTVFEYNNIDNTFELLKNNTIKVCKENNIDYYDYLGSFVRFKLYKYIKSKELIKVIKNLDFSDFITVRATLNKSVIHSKERETKIAIEKHNEIKKDLFNWLDKTKDPYFFILNPVYEYNTGIDYNSHINDRYGYKKDNYTGITNLDIAIDYIKTKTL